MLPNQHILISDEEIKEGFYKYCPFDDINKIHKQEGQYFDKHEYKIIAGIPELPSIDFSALSEEDCKKIGWVDWKRYFDLDDKKYGAIAHSYFLGFRKAQSINKKKFNIEEIFSILDLHTDAAPISYLKSELVKKLSQPKVFDVEVEMKSVYDGKEKIGVTPSGEAIYMSKHIDIPKITKNSIKITKIL